MLVTLTYISWSSDFALYLEDYLMYEHHTLGLWVSMTRHLTSNKYMWLWPIFHGPVILPYNLKTIWCMNIILWDYGSVWPDIWPQINICDCDLYFMVQWFCLMSQRLFDGWVPYFQIMRRFPQLWPQNKYRSAWPIFHSIVILLSIFKIIWWMKIVVGIMGQCDTKIDLMRYMYVRDLYFMV